MAANRVKTNAKYFDAVLNLESLTNEQKMKLVAERFKVKRDLYDFLLNRRKFLPKFLCSIIFPTDDFFPTLTTLPKIILFLSSPFWPFTVDTFLPSYRRCSLEFLQQILSGAKSSIKCAEVPHKKLPRYIEFMTKSLVEEKLVSE